MNEPTCFHCGLPNPRQPYTLTIHNECRYFCCAGCQSAAKTIVDAGLAEYYKFHKPDQHPVENWLTGQGQASFLHYDRDDTQAEFVQRQGEKHKSCILIIEGISCSACTWLIEKRLLQLAGVISATVNASTHRLSIQWDDSICRLSSIFQALFLIGYKASPFLPDEEEQIRHRTQRKYIFRLGVAGIGMMQAMMNAVALYSGDITQQHERWLWWTSLVLTLPVIFISAWPFFTSAWHSIKGRHLSMDVSVSIAILSAFFASCLATVTGHGEVYFESVNMFTFFLVLSRFLEFRARSLAHTQGNAIHQELPQTCQLATTEGSREVLVKDLQPNDIIQLMPGETCPVDGQITSGQSEFDESSFTGEFKSVPKTIGDAVSAGTINQHQKVTVRVAETGSNNSFNLLRTLIERAGAEKPRIAELADKGSRQFIWSTLIISVVIGLVWLWVDIDRAYWIVISVLVVTCPCALSLATPTALAQATLSLKNRGFVITRGYVLERLASLEAIAFDKTGTLTEGQFRVIKISRTALAKKMSLTDDEILAICAELERNSEHPIARAFPWASAEHRFEPFDGIRNLSGIGVEGSNDAGKWFLGTPTKDVLQTASSNKVLSLTLNQQLMAIIELDDQVRATTPSTLDLLSKLNVTTHVLTGDSATDLDTQFIDLGITGSYNGHLSAQEKVEWLNQLNNQNIAFVGDGLNDAPVLAKAPVSIAMLNATDMSKAQADVLMLTGDLQVLAHAVQLAKKTKRIIRQNLGWALVYNAIALPVAAVGWVAPWQAAIGMSVSSLLVVGNALRLRN